MDTRCPHCNTETLPWQSPSDAQWDCHVQYVCFNDTCPYFQRSLQWMQSHYNVAVMYRYRLDPLTGQATPIPVWSTEALREGIVDTQSGAMPEQQP